MEKYHLIVAGGGLTGVAAAVSAAREGISVLLVEASGSLGGAMNTNLVYPFMRYWTDDENGERKYLSAGIFREMVDRANALSAGDSLMDFSPEDFKIILDDMVQEAGVEVLFHAQMFGVKTEGRKVRSIAVATKAGAMELEADFFIDATGDGDLMFFAGCDMQLGRESDNLCQPMTTCFRVINVDRNIQDLEYKRTLNKRLNAAWQAGKAAGTITNAREDVLWFRGRGLGAGVAHFNTTRIVRMDPTDPFAVSRAEMEARNQVRQIMQMLKNGDFPEFANAKLSSIATSIGVRESRKLRGVHIITAQELKDCTRFDDAIALGNYDIDIHNPEGSGTSHYYFAPGTYYTIPYRCLLPREYDNLLTGGRCVSATHEAQASVRIMPICATTGQAAGVAAAQAAKTGTTAHTLDVTALQNRLRALGAAID